jgi:hypothetical protein
MQKKCIAWHCTRHYFTLRHVVDAHDLVGWLDTALGGSGGGGSAAPALWRVDAAAVAERGRTVDSHAASPVLVALRCVYTLR